MPRVVHRGQGYGRRRRGAGVRPSREPRYQPSLLADVLNRSTCLSISSAAALADVSAIFATLRLLNHTAILAKKIGMSCILVISGNSGAN